MIVVSKSCPDCGTALTVIRESTDVVAEVIPSTCPGCCRAWRATILPFRAADTSLHHEVRLHPVPRQYVRG